MKLRALLLISSLWLTGCATNRFVEWAQPLSSEQTQDINSYLDDHDALILNRHSTTQRSCESNTFKGEQAPLKRLYCLKLKSEQLNFSSTELENWINKYNRLARELVNVESVKSLIRSEQAKLGFEWSVFVHQFEIINPELSIIEHGQLGLPAVLYRANNETVADRFFPQEGIFRNFSLVFNFESIDAQQIRLKVEFVDPHMGDLVSIFGREFELKRTYSAAYALLIEHANIDDYSFLGLVKAAQAEGRRGVFAIDKLSQYKIPIIMTHGLNSDPLIWKRLTSKLLNESWFTKNYQIWHVYYPSGPPPFFNAMKTRGELRSLLTFIGNANLDERAVLIGHSMGGILSKSMSVKTEYHLWDATFKARPEQLLSKEDKQLQDIFIFEPVFEQNTVIFLDTPHLGSSIADSFIGYLGSSLVNLPENFTGLFQTLIRRLGPEVLTEKMLPFLRNYGPNSVQVLRPGHPLMESINELPIHGVAYSIIGSNSSLTCDSDAECSQITDGVVDYNSANYHDSVSRLIVSSNHDSFNNEHAIEYILSLLKPKSVP